MGLMIIKKIRHNLKFFSISFQGTHTVMGQMVDLTAANPKMTTLITSEISQFVHTFTMIGVIMGLVCMIIAFLLGYFWLDAFMFCIGVIVANVPEGLMAVITIALSVSASRLQVNFYQIHTIYLLKCEPKLDIFP